MSNATGAEQAIWPPKMPEFFYRYDRVENALKILRDGTLRFSSPGQFNDPFDCRVRPTFDGPSEQFALYLARRQFPNAPLDILLSLVRTNIDRITPEACDRVYRLWERNILDNSGMICLSEVCDDILMWAHYAQQHEGVCLQFRFESTTAFPELPLPVDYKEHYPEFNFAEQFSKVDGRDALRQVMIEFGKTVFLTKSCHWNYEKEWRIIRMALDEQPKFGSSTFPPQLLTGLILDCRMGEDKRRMLIELARAREPRLRIFEAHTKEREFALEIRQIA